MATLIAYAYRDPSKMPQFKVTGAAPAPPNTSTATDDARVRAYLIAMSKRGG